MCNWDIKVSCNEPPISFERTAQFVQTDWAVRYDVFLEIPLFFYCLLWFTWFWICRGLTNQSLFHWCFVDAKLASGQLSFIYGIMEGYGSILPLFHHKNNVLCRFSKGKIHHFATFPRFMIFFLLNLCSTILDIRICFLPLLRYYWVLVCIGSW